MNIAVFGAGGKSGQIFVRAALAHGHSISANIYNSSPFEDTKNLTVIRGDATIPNIVKNTLSNSDAVVSLVGHGLKVNQGMQTTVTKNIIDAMTENQQKRLISLTGTAVRFENDFIPIYDKFVNGLMTKFASDRIQDGIDHAELLKTSGLDWTLLRVLKLQNTPATKFSLRENGPPKLITSRHEVASAILDLLESNQFIGKAPIISY